MNARVYRKVVWQWVDGKLVEIRELEQSYQYTGPVALAGGGTANRRQIHFRVRTDAGAIDASPTWGAAEDTQFWPGFDTNVRTRIATENTGTLSGVIGNFQYLRCGYSALTTTTTSTPFVKAVDAGSSSSDVALTVQRLTSGTGTFQNGGYTEDGTFSVTLVNGFFTETELGMQLLSADLGGGETIEIQSNATASQVESYLVRAIYTVPEQTGSDFQPSAQLGGASQLTANSASISMTTAAAVPSGNELVVVAIACDNNGTTDGDLSEISSVTINGDAMTKAVEFTNGQGSAQAGATVSIWYRQVSTGYSSGVTITANFANATTSGDANAISARSFTVASGKTVAVEATNSVATDATANSPTALDATTANIECLRICATALENNPSTSPQANIKSTSGGLWSLWYTAGNIYRGVTGMSLLVEGNISTGTGKSSQVRTTIAASDWASAYVAFKTTSTSKTLAADAGSYAVTGTAASPKLGRKTAADAGSYAITGTDATPHKGYKVVAGAGSYALTGTAATPLHSWKVSAGAGSYALTGTAATLKVGFKTAAGAGSYSLTGTDATFRKTWRVAGDAGSYSLAGTDATPRHAWRLSADSGSYALTGTDASLTIRSDKFVSADAGSYSITGTAATPLKTWRISADAGSYDITGTDATAYHGRRVSADAGSYELTGTDAGLTLTSAGAFSLVADAGSYSLSGSDASMLLLRRIAADAGAYTITGSDATAVASHVATHAGGKRRKRSHKSLYRTFHELADELKKRKPDEPDAVAVPAPVQPKPPELPAELAPLIYGPPAPLFDPVAAQVADMQRAALQAAQIAEQARLEFERDEDEAIALLLLAS